MPENIFHVGLTAAQWKLIGFLVNRGTVSETDNWINGKCHTAECVHDFIDAVKALQSELRQILVSEPPRENLPPLPTSPTEA